MNLIHTEEREKDLQKVCAAILNTEPEHYDNPNGAYETTCPYCQVTVHRLGNSGSKKYKPIWPDWAEMSELNHEANCAYLIAKDLLTNIKY